MAFGDSEKKTEDSWWSKPRGSVAEVSEAGILRSTD